jgi:hypothetical protein
VVIGCWGSTARRCCCPTAKRCAKKFGTIAYSNGKDGDEAVEGERPYALASALYDLCNRVALDALMERADADEVDLAVVRLARAGTGDLVLAARNYPSFPFSTSRTGAGSTSPSVAPTNRFARRAQCSAATGPDSQVVKITPASLKVGAMREAGLPTRLRVRLSTGEYGVLVTSLLDETGLPAADFLDL